MDDLISRQAAIDALKNRWKKTRNYEGIGDDIAEECELYLKQLPSAQPEPCEDAVSREVLKDGFTEMCNLICPYTKKQQHVMCGSCLMGTAFDVLEATPSVNPKQRTGKWSIKEGELALWDVCSECKKMVMHKAPFYNYCPNCGAKMEVNNESN